MEAELNQRQDENQPEIVEKVRPEEVNEKKSRAIRPLTLLSVAKPSSDPVVTGDLLNLGEKAH